MAGSLHRLSARGVQTISRPGRHADGGNLYLAVSATGSKSWLFIYRAGARQREMGLGSLLSVTLAQARDRAAQARQALGAGKDPIDLKTKASGTPTFGQMADRHIAAMESAWRNAKHRAQWRSTLASYAAPLRPIPVDKIRTEDVIRVLQPIWVAKPETAARVRGRIESILDAARAQGLRDGDNPARRRGHLDHVLPKPKKLARGHHAAMPYAELPGFMASLRAAAGVAARGLEFAILTAARSGEVLGARWSEIDEDKRLWIVPAERMKGGREHRVPLSDRCMVVLCDLKRLGKYDFIFPGARRDKPLSNMAFAMLLRRLGADVTAHGFRSSFRDWVGEETIYPREIAEAALAHLVGDETERAYRRGDALAKRREIMMAWRASAATRSRDDRDRPSLRSKRRVCVGRGARCDRGSHALAEE